MGRALVLLVALLVAVGTILASLWTRGFPIGVSLKMAALAAGFVVSVKLVLGGYLSLRGAAEPELVELLGFYGSLGLTVFFGVATVSLWRRGTSSGPGTRFPPGP